MGLVFCLLGVIVVLACLLLRLMMQRQSRQNHRASRGFRKTARSEGWAPSDTRDETFSRKDPVVSDSSKAQSVDSSSDHLMGQQADKVEEKLSDDADVILGLSPEPLHNDKTTSPSQSPSSDVEAPIISLALIASQDRPYGGYELLQALLSNSLRFGEQQIFHRYQSQQTDSNILFSCASMVKPGTFDLSKMGGFSTPGLVLFFDAQTVKDPKQTFDLLLQTVDGLVEDMGGSVCDDKQQLFTKQTLLNIHQQLDHYIKSNQTLDLFDISRH